MRVDVTCLVISILHKILQISIHFLDEKFCSNILLNLLYLFSTSTVKKQKKTKKKEKKERHLYCSLRRRKLNRLLNFLGFFFWLHGKCFLNKLLGHCGCMFLHTWFIATPNLFPFFFSHLFVDINQIQVLGHLLQLK